MRQFLFVLQFDSFVKTLMPVIKALEGIHKVDIYLLELWNKKSWIDDNIRNLMGSQRYARGGFRPLFKLLDKDYDVVILGSVGARLNVNVSNYITRKGLSSRLASGYVGALLQNKPERFLKGVMRRAFTHLIWTPGTESRIRVLNTGLINLARTQVLATGLPRFDQLHQDSQNFVSKKENILFIEQPTFPMSKKERFDLVQKLVAVARNYPDKTVVIKPRFMQLTGHAHRPKFLLPDLLAQIPDLPENIRISANTLDKEFQTTDFALSISSTGALESLLLGIPTYFIQDYCGKNNRYGSLDFEAMGNVIDFQTVLAKKLPEINFDMVKTFLRFDGRNTQRLTEAIERLANNPESHQSLKPPVKIAFRYPHANRFELVRQRFKHTHERHPELIAAWINQGVQYSPWRSSAQLNLNMPSKQRLKKEENSPIPTGGRIMLHAFYVGDRILDIYPQIYSHDGSLAQWRLHDIDQLKTWTAFGLEWAKDGAGLMTLANSITLNDQVWAEYCCSLQDGKVNNVTKLQDQPRPRLELSQNLFKHMREHRATLDPTLSPIYAILDEVGWYDRFFDALSVLRNETTHVASN